MNKKSIILALSLVWGTIGANAQFLFRIQGNGLEKPSYILGSIHTLPGSILDSIPEFLKAEAECQQLYSEYDVSSQQKMNELQTAGQQATTLPEGQTIFDILNMEQMDALNYRFKETFNVSLTDSVMKGTWNYQPFVFLTTFNLIFATQEMQKHPELAITGTPIDLVCINRAKEHGIKLGQLDEIQSQESLTKMRDTMNEKLSVQIDSLMSFLDNFEQRKQQAVNEVLAAVSSAEYWKKSDYDSFAKSDFWLGEINKSPAIFKLRNEKWLPKIADAMREMPSLFVFGAGHLIGTYGILQLLRDAGYEVEQIKSSK